MHPNDLLLTIPHASTHIPPDIRPLIPHNDYALNHEPDLYTDELCSVPGIDTVHARVSRIVADVNRAPDEVYTSGRDRNKGVVMLTLSMTVDNTFAEDPSLELMQDWINRYHAPFHEEVDRLIRERRKRFLIDCHSMWSVAPQSHADRDAKRPDICIGNRDYTICDARTTLWMKEFWEHHGYDVRVNDPYVGRYVTGIHCGIKGTPGVQIEFNRGLYMNESSLERDAGAIKRINEQFRTFVEAFCRWDDARPRKSDVHLCDLSTGYAELGRARR